MQNTKKNLCTKIRRNLTIFWAFNQKSYVLFRYSLTI